MNRSVRANWAVVELGEIAEFRNGINYNKSNFGTGIPVISVKDFWERSFPKYDALEEINPDGVVRPEHALKNGDILFVRSNGNRELIGRSLFIRSLPTRPVTHSAFTIRVRFTSRLADPRFFAYLFRSPIIRQVLSAQGNGANISNLNQEILTRLKVALPPIAAQRGIASILSAYDDLIENNTRRIAILEEMARRIYEEWFVRFRFPGHDGVRMVESELGLVPDGWRVATVADIAERVGATVNPGAFPDELFEHYSIPAFDAARRAVLEPGRGIMSNKTRLKDEAVLVSKLNPRIPRIWSVSGSSSRKRVCSTEFIPFVPMPPYTGRLLYLFFTSAWFQERYLGLAVGTSTSHQRVKPADTEAIEVIIPSERVASKADELLAPILDLVDNLRVNVANLRTTRDLLLPKLISGELDVSAVPEPEALAE